ncbi:MAG: APC family permease [Epsilonproteobacteria bacterium]|nr:APC family permease [Campylobacterota bacterium]
MSSHTKISFWSGVLMTLNIIIGAGVYVSSQKMAEISKDASFFGWGVVGLLLLPLVWSFSYSTKIFTGEGGGFYQYCTRGINETAGFLAHWLYVLGYIAADAVLVVVVKDELAKIEGCSFFADYGFLTSVGLILVFSLLNLIGLQTISKIQSYGTVLKIIPLLMVIGWFILHPNIGTINIATPDLMSIRYTIPVAIFALFGTEACCSITHLMEGGQAQASKVIFTAFALVMILYTSFHLGLVSMMGGFGLADYGTSQFPQFFEFSGPITAFLQTFVGFAILFSMINTLFGIMLMNVTNLQTLADKKLLPGSDALVKMNRHHRPVRLVWLHAAVLTVLVAFVSNLGILMALTSLGLCATYLLNVVAVLRTSWLKKAYVGFVGSLLAMGSCGVLMYYSWIKIHDDVFTRFVYASPVMLGVVLGLVLYKVAKSRHVHA